MTTDVSDEDVLTFVLAGCNAQEIGAYTGTTEQVAKARIDHVLFDYAHRAELLP